MIHFQQNPKVPTDGGEAGCNKKEKSIFYENLLFNLNNNSLLLQTSTLHKNGNLDIAISTSDHRNAIRSSSYAAYISKEVADLNDIDLSLINVAHVNAGIELNKITYIARHLSAENNIPIELKIRNSVLDSGNTNEFLEAEFKPSINFPVIFSSISPSLVSHIGNPEKFYFGGINLQYISEVQFNRNILLSTELNLPLHDNFQDTISGSASAMRHVRTDLMQYLKEDDFHIKRMQLDYIWTLLQRYLCKNKWWYFWANVWGLEASYYINLLIKITILD